MVSTLGAQLQQLREQGAGSKQKANSFLYDPREAARLDDEMIYNLACNGLLELKKLDARFEEFDVDGHSDQKDMLFSRHRIHFHRAQVTKQEDEELNRALQRLLDALSGYFLLSASHKVLEFLVRRYEIHRYNVDAVMSTIISYHESVWFARMVRILHIHSTKWEFLLQTKKHGEEPLPRAALVQRASDEPSVLQFIFDSAARIGTGSPKLISLYTLVTLQLLEQTKIREEMLRWLIPQLLQALKATSVPELQSSAYMILTKLSSKAILTDKVLDAIVKQIVKYAQVGTQMNAMLCVIFIAQAQPSFKMSPRVGKYLLQMDNVVDFLADAALNYDTAKFLRLTLFFLAENLQAPEEAHTALFINLLANIPVVESFVEELATKLLESARAEQFSKQNPKVQAIAVVLAALGRKSVGQADAAVLSILGQQDKKAKKDKALHQFLRDTFGNVANSAHFVPSTTDVKTSLALALEHPTDSTRLEALKTLDRQHIASKDNPEATVLTNDDVLVRRLKDDNPKIVKFVASSSLGDLLLQICSKKKFLETVFSVVNRWTDASVIDVLMALLLNKFRAVHGNDADSKILLLLLSLISDDVSPKKSPISTEKVWNWIAALEHPIASAVAESKSKKHNEDSLIQAFATALASDVQGVLPFCLSWSRTSDANVTAMTPLLIKVLSQARKMCLADAKSKKKQTGLVALEQSFRFVLKKEFATVSQQAPSEKLIAYASTVANSLAELAAPVFGDKSKDEFDSCVGALLKCPIPVFLQVQGALLELFQGELENELLPTMARLAMTNTADDDVFGVLLKSRSLDLISVVLEGDGIDSAVVQVIPAVFVALSDEDKTIRQSAVACLERWTASVSPNAGKKGASELKNLHHAAEYFLEAKQDILMDQNAIAVLCGTYVTAKPTESSVFFTFLVDSICSGRTDTVVAVKLLKLLVDVRDAKFWLGAVKFFQDAVASATSSSDSRALLGGFLTHFLRVDENEKAASVPKPFFNAVLSALTNDKTAVVALEQVQIQALDQLKPAFYVALDETSQHTLVTALLALLMAAEEAVATKVIRCLSLLPVSFDVFVRLLEEKISQFKEAKGKDANLQGISCVLEVLAVKLDQSYIERESSVSVQALLRTLCSVLGLFCTNEALVSEYMMQVLFGCLRRVCEVGAKSDSISTTKSKRGSKSQRDGSVEPEQLVKHTLTCLGRATSPQTRNEALLFVSAMVKVYPASVLKSLVKILSFIGAGSMHQDDDYSFHVLETIVRAVVPHILEAQDTNLITTQQFIRVFVEAYDQIPSQRREALFHILVETLGCEWLPYCAAALVEKAVVTPNSTAEIVQFAHTLCFSFDASVQVATLVMMLRIARDLFPQVIEDSETDTDDIDDDEDVEKDEDAYDRFVFDDKVLASKPVARKLNAELVKFLPEHLRARELHHKILAHEEQEDSAMDDDEEAEDEEELSNSLQHSYLMLAQLVLLYFRRVAREQSLHEDGADGFWTQLSDQTIEILGALQQLLSTPGFVAVIGELLRHDNNLVRKKAMQLFNERLQNERDSLTPGEELLFVDMLDELDVILKNEDGQENQVNLQTALLSVDILARNFATGHAKRFQSILPTIVKYVEVDAAKASPTALHLVGCSFVCLSSICKAVGALVFPLLPRFFPKLLSGIEYASAKVGVKSDAPSVTKTVLQCLLASLEVFTEKIPQFLTPYLSRILQALWTPVLLSDNASNMPLLLSVDCSLMNLSNNVELRHLLPCVFGSYEYALKQGDATVEKLFSVVSTIVSKLTTASIRLHLTAFARFFVTALDLRRVHSRKVNDIDAVEDELLECLVNFVLRLSEKQLKPLFLKIAEWSQAKLPGTRQCNGDVARRIVMFKLTLKLSERLRGIFVPYFAHILDMLTNSLRECHDALANKHKTDDDASDSDSDDDFFARPEEPASKKKKLANGHAEVSSATEVPRESHLLMLHSIVRALNGCFVHDSDGFIDKDKFDLVMSPLVDVFDIVKYDSSEKAFAFDIVAPCIANLAWAAKNDLLWKPLHYAVLMKSRSDNAAVRLGALKTIEQCYQVIGDEFLAMLPESIPFLAELMEDNDAEVEATCHKVIKQIEDISGESLDQYLAA
ncbi:TPA: hypothetical protein N0F65_001750 [Lagenidium giganteum]|uniref:HEAT repeat-containing protein 1 n=1 Tax=Lagenidium giganteum TaxID=4803 RepID=A0AAV2Z6P6_9STRA|nr:TPA: hypothetical protein N0F65_001750 [Lagenidium giganteum]